MLNLDRHSKPITGTMIDLSFDHTWRLTAESCIQFRRCLVQALGPKDTSLLQLPHVDEEGLKHLQRGKHSVKELSEYIKQPHEERKVLNYLTAEEKLDIDCFLRHVSQVEVVARVDVEDEGEIARGDVATLTVTYTRTNLKVGRSVGRSVGQRWLVS
eukprot:GHVU01112698.1.p1 GENE.GHVU01112698.1~~GHVU01112698.1.p1  ORF type:complete len:157 (-),score=25.32 GHVU01112698.1:131-601(-)